MEREAMAATTGTVTTHAKIMFLGKKKQLINM
jgi:hypothetical protein